jgi:predicted RNase H-like HicB family nuclease
MTKNFSAIVEKEGTLYVALCPELDVASQGKSVEDALKNLKEAVKLYLDATLEVTFSLVTDPARAKMFKAALKRVSSKHDKAFAKLAAL